MEVPHTHSLKSSKNWKSYVGEFLMLFLAVFAGFIAENLRENYVDREKAHQYVSSMVGDLAKDTTKIQQIISMNKKLVKGIDSLLFYLRSSDAGAVKKIYAYSSMAGASVLFESESSTMTQLKNAGGLRLIRDTAAVNKITSYDNINEQNKKQGDAYYKSTLELLTLLEQLLDFSIVAHPSDKYFILSDPDKRRLFYNKCYIQQKIIDNYCNNLNYQKEKAKDAILLLRKNYHITE